MWCRCERLFNHAVGHGSTTLRVSIVTTSDFVDFIHRHLIASSPSRQLIAVSFLSSLYRHLFPPIYLSLPLLFPPIFSSPHPGNLLRTTDGRLCVLDWGMTLEVPKDLQYGLLDFIAHINAEDFESLPEDFVNLGFTPPNKLEQVRS